MHLPVKGLMDLFGIDLSALIEEGKVPSVGAQENGTARLVATRAARVFSFSEPGPGNFPDDHYLLTACGPSVARR
jgi:hypothetical protein